ncbi:AfsR/SARP family transcriptional regulator [Streptomyces sp. L7]
MGVLRRLLEPELPMRATGRWLVRDAGGYRLNASPQTLDVLRFRELVRRAREAGGAEAAVPLYLEALNLRTGTVATGVPVEARSHPAFNALEREHLGVVEEAADAGAGTGAVGQLLAVLHRAAAEHPLDEPLQAHLVGALAATGQRAAALDTWRRVRAVLASELGVEPGAELRAVQGRRCCARVPRRRPRLRALRHPGVRNLPGCPWCPTHRRDDRRPIPIPIPSCDRPNCLRNSVPSPAGGRNWPNWRGCRRRRRRACGSP